MLRREFIKSVGLAASGAVVGAGLDQLFSKADAPLKCFDCGARVKRWNSYGVGNKSGVFCPNCGIEVGKGAFLLPSSAMPFLTSRKKQPINRKWECALVPFPNPDLIAQSDKPKLKFSQIKF